MLSQLAGGHRGNSRQLLDRGVDPQLPAVENRSCCDSWAKVTALLKRGGFSAMKVWTEQVMNRWRPEDHFEYQVHSSWREELESLAPGLFVPCAKVFGGPERSLSGMGALHITSFHVIGLN